MLQKILNTIVMHESWHAKWLNTLSYLENCGARKIAKCQHITLVPEEMLKHAAEEFRHAHYLKRQIARVTSRSLPDYSLKNLIGGILTLRYLTQLDCKTYRLLLKDLPKEEARKACYLLVTYAIELRAQELYPLYEEILRATASPVRVKSIVLEEEEHLSEMRQGLNALKNGKLYALEVCAIEADLYKDWLDALQREICS